MVVDAVVGSFCGGCCVAENFVLIGVVVVWLVVHVVDVVGVCTNPHWDGGRCRSSCCEDQCFSYPFNYQTYFSLQFYFIIIISIIIITIIIIIMFIIVVVISY